MTNPAIRPQPNGDVDISVQGKQAEELAEGKQDPQPEPSVDPANLDHPEELMGE
jgi:hypothetical protein